MKLITTILIPGLVLGLTVACGGTVEDSSGGGGDSGAGSGGDGSGGLSGSSGSSGGSTAGGTGGLAGGTGGYVVGGASGSGAATGATGGWATGGSGAATGATGGVGGAPPTWCPPQVPSFEDVCEPSGSSCNYDAFNGCLCAGSDLYWCEIADPLCPYGGAAGAGGAGTGGSSSDIEAPCGPDGCGAAPPPPLVQCVCEGAWYCTSYY